MSKSNCPIRLPRAYLDSCENAGITSKMRFPSISLDCLLLATIVGLLVVLSWPAIEIWQNRPRPGVQVCQQYVQKENGSADAVASQVDYLLYLPREYEAGHKWPLLVFLHGARERGQDLNVVRRLGPPRQIDQGKQLPFIIVCPQCPENSHWIPEQVVKLIEHISNRFPVDPDRVYLTGYSMGAYATWQTACYDPGRFAAIAPLSGGGNVEQAKRLAHLPIWAFHGANDPIVPLEKNKAMVDAVRKCGGYVKFTVYPGYKHGICDVAYRDKRLYEWLLAQRRTQCLK